MTTPEPPDRRRAVAEGMAAARERGVRLGRPQTPLPPAAHRAGQLRGQGLSLTGIAAALNAEQVPTPSGRGAWAKSSVQYVLARLDEQPPTEDP
jgi:hypothetical protein